MKIGKIDALLIAIIALGLALRVWNIDWGLPFIPHPDEPLSVNGAIRMLKTGDLDPHNYHWGSLIFYLNAMMYGIYFLIGKLAGSLASPADIPYLSVETIGVGYAPIPLLMILSRGLVALGGTASVVLIYWIGREMHNRMVGILAALFLAISPTSIMLSHYVKSDTFLVTFSLVAAYAALRILREPHRGNYVLAGIGIGLALASKYNAILIALPIIVAHFSVFGWRGFVRREILLAALVAEIAFLMAMPFALIDFSAFWSGLTFDIFHYSTGHTGAEGNSLVWYSDFLWNGYGVLLLLAVGGIVTALRSPRGRVLAVFPVAYFGFISLFAVHFDSTILPIAPFILLFASEFLLEAYNWITSRVTLAGSLAPVVAGVVVVLVAFPSFSVAVNNDQNLGRPDERETARVWINANLPRGARVAIEPYAPYLDPDKFMVQGVEDITAHSPEWYGQNGFEYVVLSYGSYGRFFENAALYSDMVNRYNAFFTQLTPVARFGNDGDQVRVLRTNVTQLPTTRVAANWGIFGSWLELVGYDWDAPNLTLYWRGLEARRERFTLTTRLLDRNNQEIAADTSDLFEGINTNHLTVITRTIAAPPTPGLYRVELDIDASGQGRIPVLGSENQPVSDKYSLGPVKFAPTPPSADELSRGQPVNAHFDNGIALLGYILERGRLVLYWQSTQPIDKDYTVFIHLLDANSRITAQADAAPFGGTYPTWVWSPGEIIRDEHTFFDVPPGKQRLELGLYEYPSLSRLNIKDTSGNVLGDHVDLEVTVP